MKKIKVIVEYPWYGIKDDSTVLEIDDFDEKSINDIAFETALDMIIDRGVSWSYEEIN